MSLVEIKDFTTLIDNQLVFEQRIKTNKKRIKELSKCQETMIIQQEIHYSTNIIKIINSFV